MSDEQLIAKFKTLVAAITAPDKPRRRRRAYAVNAKPCPICTSRHTRVYRSLTVIRYCRCLDCRATWRQVPA